MYKNRTVNVDDEEDNFETDIFADIILGELGSSSSSHKDAMEEDGQAVLDGDSGSSDHKSSHIVGIQSLSAETQDEEPKLQTTSYTNCGDSSANPSSSAEEATKYSLPIVDVPVANTKN